jgi:hypothetical protein
MSMDARITRAALVSAALLFSFCLSVTSADAAGGYRTKNFVVTAPTPQLAKEIGDSAEMWRKKQAIEWLGKELPPWSRPCPITAQVDEHLGAGGATSFVFDQGEVYDWQMNIQGSRQRILDSVLPHEVTHTIFASHFRRALPRWADEGACTTVEHRSEVAKQEKMLIQFLKTGRGIPFTKMFKMKDYPRDILPLYSQGHSLSQLLIESRGKKAFLTFLEDGMRDGDWQRAVDQHYEFENLLALQNAWMEWVREGRPKVDPESRPGALVALRERTKPVYRGQSPDAEAPPEPQAGWRSPKTSSGNSIYVALAEPEKQAKSAPATPTRTSVYDASLGQGRLLR